MALVVVAALALLGVVHLYWSFGGLAAGVAAIPEVDGRPAFSPSRAATLVVAGALFAAAGMVALAGRLVPNPFGPAAIRVFAYGLGVVFLARAVGDFRLVGFYKRVRNTRFARLDTRFYAPFCLALGLAILYIAHQNS
jgi:Protein of unknown function (DUF3995)